MDSEFGIDFVSHDEYEYLAVEISLRGQRVCQMFRRREDDGIEVEIVENHFILDPPVLMRFALTPFLEVLERARRELLSLRLDRVP